FDPIQDIRRIANSLFKTFRDIICQQNRFGHEFYDENKKKDDPIIITLGLVELQGKLQAVEERLKHRGYNRCLYTQLQHVELELTLLGPHRFQNPQSYLQAVRQVQHSWPQAFPEFSVWRLARKEVIFSKRVQTDLLGLQGDRFGLIQRK
uniref:Uncharacterized protein n=1 Tax=Varanus komodoensis TaxID=61221 RepID=A0A8D2ILF2_VARKO